MTGESTSRKSCTYQNETGKGTVLRNILYKITNSIRYCSKFYVRRRIMEWKWVKVSHIEIHRICRKYTRKSLFINGKAIPVNRPWRSTGLWDVEAPTLSLDNRLTDGGKVVSLTRPPPFAPQEDSWYSFLLEVESTPGPWCGWKEKVSWKTHLIGTRTRDLPAFSVVLSLLMNLYGWRYELPKHRGWFPPSTSISPTNSHSKNCFTFIIHSITDHIRSLYL
jgi:hypothetical protein